MMKHGLAGAALLLAATGAAAQSADDRVMLAASNPPAIVQFLQGMGYRATLAKQSDGDPKIESAMSGYDVTILFLNCKDNRNCEDVQFYTGIATKRKLSLSQVNDFNSRRRFTRLYLDDDQDPYLELDLSLIGPGISGAAFRDTVKVWESQLGNLRQLIDAAK